MRTILLGIAALVLFTTLAVAGKKQVRYIGIHPIPKAEGGGFCNIEGPHVHIFGASKLEYRDHRGHNHFVGDPVAYGYDGPRHAYKGHHPIEVHAVVNTPEPDVEFCYLNGPHYHYFTPPEGPDFRLSGEAYFYVGTPPPVYVEARPAMIEINAVYKPIVYARPVIEVEAPVGWIGLHATYGVGMGIVTPVVVAPRAHVHTPGVVVDVHVPAPTLRVDVGIGIGGGVHVGGHSHRGHGKHKKFKHKGKKRRW
ncbi:MAG: hypothetical protein M4D80_18870 [Myxococcota bacterium]|nr:hypothetical protein [Deltaproteobacteria bacterium]MDQ3337231.1 hypothetical protein [Myxococcota bacterium]